MRRKKLANKIVSILMAGMMVAATPMSALAEEMPMSEDDSVVWQSETNPTDDTVYEDETGTEEAVEEADEDITMEQESDEEDVGGRFTATLKKAR